jgi:hypothetical protein
MVRLAESTVCNGLRCFCSRRRARPCATAPPQSLTWNCRSQREGAVRAAAYRRRGMGLALAVELNGYPDPLHVPERVDRQPLTINTNLHKD